MTKVFIDGHEGTTGLRIYERLEARADIALIPIADAYRKDPAARKECLNQADIAILCLPDEAAKESVSLIDNPNTKVLDTSTAHRTNANWVYGFPELSSTLKDKVCKGTRIAVPGCHASGFISLVSPLVQGGILSSDAMLTCHSITGYSGGGKKMIAQYESDAPGLTSPRQYGLTQMHKHLQEMQAISGIQHQPIFCPIVSNFYSGMAVTVPLFGKDIKLSNPVDALRELFQDHFHDAKLMKVFTKGETEALGGFLPADGLSGKDSMEIMVTGNNDRILLISRFDNLGKGSSGAAVECLNLVMGLDELTGLYV